MRKVRTKRQVIDPVSYKKGWDEGRVDGLEEGRERGKNEAKGYYAELLEEAQRSIEKHYAAKLKAQNRHDSLVNRVMVLIDDEAHADLKRVTRQQIRESLGLSKPKERKRGVAFRKRKRRRTIR